MKLLKFQNTLNFYEVLLKKFFFCPASQNLLILHHNYLFANFTKKLSNV